jgi:SAM-dependent methyltransferase
MNKELNANYWNDRYLKGDIPWDIGIIAPAFKAYFDQLTNRKLRILIPGAGRATEAVYLHFSGFSQVFALDWAPEALSWVKKVALDFPAEHLLVQDFFELKGQFDLIVEQTFFCAIDPSLRTAYAEKVAQLLAPGGQLIGLLFAQPFPFDGPPFGGSKAEYEAIFQPFFSKVEIEESILSIEPRMGNELWVSLGQG